MTLAWERCPGVAGNEQRISVSVSFSHASYRSVCDCEGVPNLLAFWSRSFDDF